MIPVNSAVKSCLDKAGICLKDIQKVLIHQANGKMDEAILKRLFRLYGEKEIPADMFWWEGPDGSKVLTYRIPISYNDSRSVRGRIEKVMEQFRDQPFRSFMSYYGAGDHGGGATKENIASIKEIQNESGAPVLIFSTPEKYFTEIRGDENLNLPVIKDDLQHHAVGCYTAETEIKKNNRLSEAALITAEKISALGSVIWNFKYPREEFTSAWKRVLFLQFHDSLAGTLSISPRRLRLCP